MWIQLPDGRYGRVEEIVDTLDVQNEKTILESKRDLKQAEFDALALKINDVKDPELRAILDKSLEEAAAPVVNLNNDIQNLQGKLEEIQTVEVIDVIK